VGGLSTLSTATDRESLDRCPIESVAVAVILRAPPGPAVESHVDVKSPAGSVSDPTTAPSTENSTTLTPWSSVAVASSGTEPRTVAPWFGLVNVTLGGASETGVLTSNNNPSFSFGLLPLSTFRSTIHRSFRPDPSLAGPRARAETGVRSGSWDRAR